ncbi:MAG: hypothetical protein AAGF94_16925 [Pseudomonadota bacterium]
MQYLCTIKRALAVATALFVTAPAYSASFVMGDGTPNFSLTNDPPNAAVTSNQNFFENILGSGTSVGVFDETVFGAATETVNFYNSLTGVSASFFSGPITAATLSSYDLVALINLDRIISVAEASALSTYESNGGTLLLIGDPASVVAQTVPRLNDLLVKLGSSLVLSTTSADNGSNSATGAQIDDTTITAGVTNFSYGAASQISGGGTPLLRLANGAPFAVYDGPRSDITIGNTPPPPVPLPAAGWLLLAGVSTLVFRSTKRRT